MYPAISTDDLSNIPIGLPSAATARVVVKKVRVSRSIRLQSRKLLEIVKRGVEIAIEQNETEALEWLRSPIT
jgi:hypothetical protein